MTAMIERLEDVAVEERYGTSPGSVDALTEEELDALEAEAAADDAAAILAILDGRDG
jgi:hypothetical protein